MLNKILIYNSGGGLGDSIQLFPLILSLKNHFKKSKIYYFLDLSLNTYNTCDKEIIFRNKREPLFIKNYLIHLFIYDSS